MEQPRKRPAVPVAPEPVVRESEIVLLWADPDALATLKQRNRPTAVRVAAVRPGQALSSEDFEVLEELGVLVVQVPPSVPSNRADVAKFLTGQLRAGSKATAHRMTALSTCGSATDATEQCDRPLSKKDEAQFLELINAPESQLGAPL